MTTFRLALLGLVGAILLAVISYVQFEEIRVYAQMKATLQTDAEQTAVGAVREVAGVGTAVAEQEAQSTRDTVTVATAEADQAGALAVLQTQAADSAQAAAEEATAAAQLESQQAAASVALSTATAQQGAALDAQQDASLASTAQAGAESAASTAQAEAAAAQAQALTAVAVATQAAQDSAATLASAVVSAQAPAATAAAALLQTQQATLLPQATQQAQALATAQRQDDRQQTFLNTNQNVAATLAVQQQTLLDSMQVAQATNAVLTQQLFNAQATVTALAAQATALGIEQPSATAAPSGSTSSDGVFGGSAFGGSSSGQSSSGSGSSSDSGASGGGNSGSNSGGFGGSAFGGGSGQAGGAPQGGGDSSANGYDLSEPYTTDDGQLSLLYPAGWEAFGENSTAIIINTPNALDQLDSNRLKPGTMLLVFQHGGEITGGLAFWASMDMAFAENSFALQDMLFLGVNELEVDGYDSAAVSQSKNENVMLTSIYILPTSDTSLVARVICHPDDVDEATALLVAVLKTVKLQ